MTETDHYTKLVRNWSVVHDKINEWIRQAAKAPERWNRNHSTSPVWSPGRHQQHDPRSVNEHLKDPNLYAPSVVISEWIIYEGSKHMIVTPKLELGAIGSFHLGVTVAEWNCLSRHMVFDVWMSNIMDRHSFGKFAKYFPLSAQKPQYMWWNWKQEFFYDGMGYPIPWISSGP